MTELDPTQLVSEGGVAAGLLWIIYKVGTRMIAAIDKLANRVGNVESTVAQIAGAVGVKIPRDPSVNGRSQTEPPTD